MRVELCYKLGNCKKNYIKTPSPNFKIRNDNDLYIVQLYVGIQNISNQNGDLIISCMFALRCFCVYFDIVARLDLSFTIQVF